MRILHAALAVLSSHLNVVFMTVPVSAQLLDVVRNQHHQEPQRLRKGKGKRLSDFTTHTPLRERDAQDDVPKEHEHGRSLKGENEMWVSPNFSMTTTATAAVETSEDSAVDTKVVDMLVPAVAIYEPTNGDGESINSHDVSRICICILPHHDSWNPDINSCVSVCSVSISNPILVLPLISMIHIDTHDHISP